MISSLKARHDWCVGASHCSSAFLGFEIYFLVRKLYQQTGGHMLTLKIGTIKVSGQSGQIGQTSHINRSDRSIQVCQNANWTVPLCRTHRDDLNAYIERPIRSPDEGVMSPGIQPGLTGTTTIFIFRGVHFLFSEAFFENASEL